MSILTGDQIRREIQLGAIVIDPFRPEAIGPNSINLRLGKRLLLYTDLNLDMKRDNATVEHEIGEGGVWLRPGNLYLCHTEEYTETHRHVPVIDGRSSVARLGISIHLTAGRGDVGFCGQFTLEITVVKPVVVYAGVEICQMTYHTVEGDVAPYSGKYLRSRGPVASRLWKDFTP